MLVSFSLFTGHPGLRRARGGPCPQERGGARGARRVVEATRLPPPPVSRAGETRSPARVSQLPEAAAQHSAVDLSAIFLAPCAHGGAEHAPSVVGALSTRPQAPFLGAQYY
ncbi:hypothetical protein NDU88_005135 [Pleurodeles waltl]|uniref:Uncharacterized protein n=1 Tax=Pleurodeles waltl TaxID=8319 RepID=A0AAV7PHQ3_PLEWA|nr:hypothetical protein NDU88_005135 [Pleurodeles waltl]